MGEQLVGVSVGPDDIDPGLAENPHEPLAQQHGIVGDDDSQGCGTRVFDSGWCDTSGFEGCNGFAHTPSVGGVTVEAG
ncbi:hypothetical protein GCM10027413_14390 [Conyzicola nivalis]|uniref:Uncharacterized protein n=1 Tax=Conyzicola nivalis TaxID=1477021 RepID=A0A916WI38_9MICO|nr:hypothetical protein GCM10010979_12230 [Conyzicola nivalis]